MADIDATLLPTRPITGKAGTLRLGFLPLTDSAPLLAAEALGLFARHGVQVELTPLKAWVALRDRMAIGQLDGGQVLAPMPIASALGLGGMAIDLAVVSVLSRQGNTITFSEAMIAEMAAHPRAAERPMPADCLAQAIAARRIAGRPAPILAVVFPYSTQNYLLRHWLAQSGIDPERDVEIHAVPPSMVAGELAEGRIDGFCAGQPWGSRAVDLRCGQIALTTGDIWPQHPEKMLALSAACLAANEEPVTALIAALAEAGAWLADPANITDAARIVRNRALPDVPEAVIARSLTSELAMAQDGVPQPAPGPQFHPDASCPHPGHGEWFLSQMRHWGDIANVPAGLVGRIWRQDIWARGMAAAGLSASIPAVPPCPLPLPALAVA